MEKAKLLFQEYAMELYTVTSVHPSVADPYVFGPPGSGSGSVHHQAK